MSTQGQGFLSAKAQVDEALAGEQLPSCALDEQGIKDQEERHARLAPSVVGLERDAETVVFCFADDFDRRALEEMVAVEQQCCPFFRFAFDEDERRLTVGVKEPEMQPALDAIAEHLGARLLSQGERSSRITTGISRLAMER